MKKHVLRVNRVYIGKPLYFKPAGKRATQEEYEKMTAQLMDAIYDWGENL